MNLTRINTGETVRLEDGFLWSDEFNWQPIKQQLDYAVDGTPIVQEGKKKVDVPSRFWRRIPRKAGSSANI